MIYLAPIQGFTDFIYRKSYASVFAESDVFFIPYIAVKNQKILNKYKREVLPENNPQKKVVPQVLIKNKEEMLFLSVFLKDLGYKEINLNLGCPYPMVTGRKMGSGLLPDPEMIREILSAFFEKTEMKLSVKIRAGLHSFDEIKKVIPILNEFPLTEVIFHPRVAKQLYTGDINLEAFESAKKNLKHQLVYNGNIFSSNDFLLLKKQFPETNHWMIGRGILQNPFLPGEIKNSSISDNEKMEKLKEFHELMLKGYSDFMDNEGNVLNKMKQFWTFFSFMFPNQKKTLKIVKKTRNLNDLQVKAKTIFLTLD